MESITEAELLEEIRAALGDPGPDDAYTTMEIAGLLGVSQNTARERIRPLVMSGRMKPVRVRRTRMDGVVQTTTAYRLV